MRRTSSSDSGEFSFVNTPDKFNIINNRSFQEDAIEEEPSTKLHSNNSSPSRIMLSCKQTLATMAGYMSSIRMVVLLVLCLQNSMFTILRRYSQGVLRETYSKHELLFVAEVIKIVYSAWMISKTLDAPQTSEDGERGGIVVARKSLSQHLIYLVSTSRKMMALALIYGIMNILSFVSLRNISAGMFTIFAQTKILTTATFSTIMLKRQYSWTKWRALIALMMGVLLFSEPIWGGNSTSSMKQGNALIGTVAVLIEVSLSGFASIYFEKVIKTDSLQLGIWERNFQLALGSMPVYVLFIIADGGGMAGFFGGWSVMTLLLSGLGAAGGLLVALSIKYGDSILKTLATTGAIVLTGLLDYLFLGGPLTPSMMIAGVQVIVSICNYTFDASPATISSTAAAAAATTTTTTTTATTTNTMDPIGSPLKSSSKTVSQFPAIAIPSSGADDQAEERNIDNSSNKNANNEAETLLRRV